MGPGPHGSTREDALLTMRVSKPDDRSEATVSTSSLFHGVISGQRRRSHDEVADRADRIASGLQELGVGQGDSVCMLMRNDIAFIEAAYAAMRLGAYGVPINWHFKPEEINYVLTDSGSRVLVAHADMLHQLRDAIPEGVTTLSVPTPPEILANYKVDPDHLATAGFAIDFESWLKDFLRYEGPAVPQPKKHDLYFRHHGPSQGRTPRRADAGAVGERRTHARDDLRPETGRPHHPARTALSLCAELVRPARRPPRWRSGADAAV